MVGGQEAAQGWLHPQGLLLGTVELLLQEIKLHGKTEGLQLPILLSKITVV